jgi:hypothetical protein
MPLNDLYLLLSLNDYVPLREKERLYMTCPDRYLAYTDKKENQIFLIYKDIQNGPVAKSYRTNDLLIYGEICAHFLIY